MNIVKFRDTIIEGDDRFNSKFKGKYCYVVNWWYCVAFDDITSEHYVDLSYQNVQDVDLEFIDYRDYIAEVDVVATEKANSIEKFRYLNEFAVDDNITLDELKMFRTWLASILHENQQFIESYTDDVDKLNHMLEYYKADMTDAAVYALATFADEKSVTTLSLQSGCGCSSSPTYQLGATPAGVTICDPLMTYRHNIYLYMVQIFSDIAYWLGQVEICGEMKKYIDGIIKANLPLASSVANQFEDCACLNLDKSEQIRLMDMLSQLSIALGYIVDDDVTGHRNYITHAFSDWSTYLYEKMRW